MNAEIVYGYGPPPDDPGTILGWFILPEPGTERWGCRSCGYRWP
jgi:hypothetical protein